MSINSNATSNNQNWNSKKLIDLSDNLGQAYNPGLNLNKSVKKADFWTVDKLITMSRNLSSAYGVDL